MPRYLPEELKRAGLKSWSALATACGVTPTSISLVRLGKRPLSSSLREKVASALGVPAPLAEMILSRKPEER